MPDPADEQIEKFVEAIEKGFNLYATQETINQLRKIDEAFANTFRPLPFIESGILVAIKPLEDICQSLSKISAMSAIKWVDQERAQQVLSLARFR